MTCCGEARPVSEDHPAVSAGELLRPGDEPSWDLLRYLAATSSFTPAGKAAMRTVFDGLESMLGSSWPKRQVTAGGPGFGELIRFVGLVSELPRVLMFYTRLLAALKDPTFVPVMQVLKKAPDLAAWRHILLQLEVARLARAAGWEASFEPSIQGSKSMGDVLVGIGVVEQFVVETTTLGQTDRFRQADAFDDVISDGVRAIERQFGVNTIVEVTERLDAEDTRRWLSAIASSAAKVQAAGKGIQLDGPGGTVRLQGEEVPVGTATFTGLVREEGLGHRLSRLVAKKAGQSAGPNPAWLRVDGRDGLFTFSPWAMMAPAERVATLAAELEQALKDHEHVHGIIYTSGMANVAPGVDASSMDTFEQADRGFLVRRALAPYLARETIVLVSHPHGLDVARGWADAYADEPAWLDADLGDLGLPPLAAFRR
jgi:hypothetical protein